MKIQHFTLDSTQTEAPTESSGSNISFTSGPFLPFVPVLPTPPAAACLPFLGGPPAYVGTILNNNNNQHSKPLKSEF